MLRRPGDVLGAKYRLEYPLASGGMGELWVARHLELNVDRALKFRKRNRLSLDAHGEARFKQEAQLAALRSRHVAHILLSAAVAEQAEGLGRTMNLVEAAAYCAETSVAKATCEEPLDLAASVTRTLEVSTPPIET